MTFSNAWQWSAVALAVFLYMCSFILPTQRQGMINLQLTLICLTDFWWEGDCRGGNKNPADQFSLLVLALHTLKPRYLVLLLIYSRETSWHFTMQRVLLVLFILLLSIERLCAGIISACDLVFQFHRCSTFASTTLTHCSHLEIAFHRTLVIVVGFKCLTLQRPMQHLMAEILHYQCFQTLHWQSARTLQSFKVHGDNVLFY